MKYIIELLIGLRKAELLGYTETRTVLYAAAHLAEKDHRELLPLIERYERINNKLIKRRIRSYVRETESYYDK